jgi:hypothetical protein
VVICCFTVVISVIFMCFSFPQVSPAVLFAFWQHKHYHESSEQSSDYPQNLLFRHIFFLRRSELR